MQASVCVCVLGGGGLSCRMHASVCVRARACVRARERVSCVCGGGGERGLDKRTPKTLPSIAIPCPILQPD